MCYVVLVHQDGHVVSWMLNACLEILEVLHVIDLASKMMFGNMQKCGMMRLMLLVIRLEFYARNNMLEMFI